MAIQENEALTGPREENSNIKVDIASVAQRVLSPFRFAPSAYNIPVQDLVRQWKTDQDRITKVFLSAICFQNVQRMPTLHLEFLQISKSFFISSQFGRSSDHYVHAALSSLAIRPSYTISAWY